MKEKVQEYARLLVRVGLNVQKDQRMVDLLPGGLRLVRPAVRPGGLRRRM